MRTARLAKKHVAMEPLTTVHYADGQFGSIETSKFNKLLEKLKNSNPAMKSDPAFGQEVVLKDGRYFRSNSEFDKELIKKSTAEAHSSMTLKEFDKMLLDELG